MRTLSATLEAAQKAASAKPYLRVRVWDMLGGVIRSRWTSLYAGSETDNPSNAVITGQGTLYRARINASAQAGYQRIANPAPASDFSAWGTFAGSYAQLALAALGSTIVRLTTTPAPIYLTSGSVSDDDGLTFSSLNLLAEADPASQPALAIKTTTPRVVLAIYTAQAAPTLWAIKNTDGTAADPVEGPTFTSITGLTCCYNGDFNILITGTDANGPGVWQCLYGDGYSQTADTFSDPVLIHRAASGGPISYKHPSLIYADAYRATWLEAYAGPVAYNRPLATYMPPADDFVNANWREPYPLNISASGGPASLAKATSFLWLATAARVWRAPYSASTTDISADVLTASLDERPHSGRGSLTLDNFNGTYKAAAAGEITPGMALEIDPGYTTAAANEYPSGSPTRWQITTVRQTQAKGRAVTELELASPWAILAEWKAPRQLRWAAADKSFFNLLSFVAARSGYEISSIGSLSTIMTDISPAWAILPGTSGLTAWRALLDRLLDVAVVRSATLYLTKPASDNASTYALGTTHHLLSSELISGLADVSMARAIGTGITADSLNQTQIDLMPHRIKTISTPELTTASYIQEAADAITRKALMQTPKGHITIYPHCGVELWDVVDVTQASAGWSAKLARVIGIKLEYSRLGKLRYEQTLTLGEV